MEHITLKETQNTPKLTAAAKAWCRANLEYLNKPMTLFGTSLKVEKEGHKSEVRVMYLAPTNKVSSVTLCAGARMAGCEKDCLINSGHLGMSQGQRAATKRTVLLLLRRPWFDAQVLREVDKGEARALRTGIPAAFRLNGTSDVDFTDLIAQRPESQFYDYSKQLGRVTGNRLANYDLTFSGSMASPAARRALKAALGAKVRIALAWNTKESKKDSLLISKYLGGRKLVSFDTNDLRFLDPKDALGTLTSKGTNAEHRAAVNKEENTFWVTAANLGDLSNIIAKA